MARKKEKKVTKQNETKRERTSKESPTSFWSFLVLHFSATSLSRSIHCGQLSCFKPPTFCYIMEAWHKNKAIDTFRKNSLSLKRVEEHISRNAHPMDISQNWLTNLLLQGDQPNSMYTIQVLMFKCLVSWPKFQGIGRLGIGWMGTSFSVKVNFSEMGQGPWILCTKVHFMPLFW